MAESSSQTFSESISTHVNILSGSGVSQEIALPIISGSSSYVSTRWVGKRHGLTRLTPLACLSGQQLLSTLCRKILKNVFISLKRGNKRTAWADSQHYIVILFNHDFSLWIESAGTDILYWFTIWLTRCTTVGSVQSHDVKKSSDPGKV